MSRIRECLKRQSIQKQIHWSIVVISVVCALILGLSCYFVSTRMLVNNYRENFSYNLEISDNIINIQMENIVELSRSLLTNDIFMEVLNESRIQPGKYFNSSQSHALEQALSRILAQDTFMAEAAVIDNQGKLYCYRLNIGATNSYIRENILEEDWVFQVQQAEGKEVFFANNVLAGEKTSETFSMGKRLTNIKTHEEAGYLIINVRKKVFANSFVDLKESYESNCFFAMAEDGGLSYFRGNENYRDDILEEYQDINAWNNKFIFARAHNGLLDWELVSVMKKSELTGDSKLIGIVILAVICGVAFLGAVFSRMISARIYEPLDKLGIMIKEVGNGNRRLTQTFDDGEVGQIGNQFKEMIHNNVELRENLMNTQIKEREAELMLLQSQINPHFLYNTLDSIYCMAIINRQDSIAKMVEALSKTFRLSLNNGNKLVRVKSEIEHIESYMQIQNFRFNSRFDLVLKIPEEVQNLYVLKFILQPFVENAMYHGLEPKVGKGRIKVWARRQGETLSFYVEDDGVGIDDLSRVYKGYGVSNVMERIRLYYGKNYGVEFTSTPGTGTKVTITVAASYDAKELEHETGSDCG